MDLEKNTNINNVYSCRRSLEKSLKHQNVYFLKNNPRKLKVNSIINFCCGP